MKPKFKQADGSLGGSVSKKGEAYGHLRSVG